MSVKRMKLSNAWGQLACAQGESKGIKTFHSDDELEFATYLQSS